MKKTITASGPGGNFEGVIEITLGYKKEKEFLCPPFLEKELIEYYYHKIEASINGDKWKSILDILNISKIESLADSIEKELQERIDCLASENPVSYFRELMKSKGYN